jgi:hypothetical protein
MAVSMTAFWNNVGTVIPGGDAEYVVAEQPIAEYDNWFNYNIVADIQAVIDDVINKFNANTILKADTDNTPAALVIAEQTIVGRKTGSSIAALTATEVRNILNVEDGAAAAKTNNEIRDAVEAATDSNTFKDADHTKLNGIATGAEANLFEEVANVLREKSAAGYDNDFVIGSPQLADDGNTAHDYRMWFDKSKGAFRAGHTTDAEWDDANVGYDSFACGCNTEASGLCSFSEGGSNTSSGQYSHTEGYCTQALGRASHAEGNAAIAHLYYQHVISSGAFAVVGDAQCSNIVISRDTTDATQSELTIGGGVYSSLARLTLQANRTWGFTVNIVARQTAGSGTVGDSGIYKIEGGIKRDGSNNTALVGVITKTILAEDQSAWDVTAEADDTNECLVIKVTGEASKTIHWVAKVDLVEVG